MDAVELLKERGLHYFGGSPNEGQSLEQLESLFYAQLDLLKSGEVDYLNIKENSFIKVLLLFFECQIVKII